MDSSGDLLKFGPPVHEKPATPLHTTQSKNDNALEILRYRLLYDVKRDMFAIAKFLVWR